LIIVLPVTIVLFILGFIGLFFYISVKAKHEAATFDEIRKNLIRSNT
jgi:flagellar basal body-associated protein FliL